MNNIKLSGLLDPLEINVQKINTFDYFHVCYFVKYNITSNCVPL